MSNFGVDQENLDIQYDNTNGVSIITITCDTAEELLPWNDEMVTGVAQNLTDTFE